MCLLNRNYGSKQEPNCHSEHQHCCSLESLCRILQNLLRAVQTERSADKRPRPPQVGSPVFFNWHFGSCLHQLNRYSQSEWERPPGSRGKWERASERGDNALSEYSRALSPAGSFNSVSVVLILSVGWRVSVQHKMVKGCLLQEWDGTLGRAIEKWIHEERHKNAFWIVVHHFGPGRCHISRSQEVINPPQIPKDECVGVCWKANWWELSVGSQSPSSYPEALPKSGVITLWSWNWIPMILVLPPHRRCLPSCVNPLPWGLSTHTLCNKSLHTHLSFISNLIPLRLDTFLTKCRKF